MAYLGAAEWFQNHPDSTAAVFRRLVLQDPGFRLDTLRFPPTITGVYDALRKQTYTVRADVAPTTEIRLGDARALVTLTSATPHRVRASLVREGAPAQKLLETTVSDTATVTWDGRFGSVAASDGTYDLAIASFDSSGRPIH